MTGHPADLANFYREVLMVYAADRGPLGDLARAAVAALPALLEDRDAARRERDEARALLAEEEARAEDYARTLNAFGETGSEPERLRLVRVLTTERDEARAERDAIQAHVAACFAVLGGEEGPLLHACERAVQERDDARTEADVEAPTRSPADIAVERACQEPTLVDALAWIALWECERVIPVAHVVLNGGPRVGGDGRGWDTCFHLLIDRVLKAWRDDPLGDTAEDGTEMLEGSIERDEASAQVAALRSLLETAELAAEIRRMERRLTGLTTRASTEDERDLLAAHDARVRAEALTTAIGILNDTGDRDEALDDWIDGFQSAINALRALVKEAP